MPSSGLSETGRARAFERFELLRPSLEGSIPLARGRGLALRTARRCIAFDRREGQPDMPTDRMLACVLCAR